MQFDRRHRDEILAGEVTLTFRRWKRRQAVPGNRYRTSLGLVEVETVEVIEPGDVSDADARLAGEPSAEALLERVGGDPSLPLYRVAFHVVEEPDPRSVLAATDELTDDDRREITRRLDRLDAASTHGPWTRQTLSLIAERPGTRAGDLAASGGRETQPFKTDVRKLKNLGLTHSLDVGYELSPRGRAYLTGHGPPSGR
jgi:hypothetical protein